MLHVGPTDIDDRAEVGRLTAEVQADTGDRVELAFIDRGYSGPKAAVAASAHGIALEVVKAPEAKRGFVLLPRRWGGGAFVRQGRPVLTLGQRLRTLRKHSGRIAHGRLISNECCGLSK